MTEAPVNPAPPRLVYVGIDPADVELVVKVLDAGAGNRARAAEVAAVEVERQHRAGTHEGDVRTSARRVQQLLAEAGVVREIAKAVRDAKPFPLYIPGASTADGLLTPGDVERLAEAAIADVVADEIDPATGDAEGPTVTGEPTAELAAAADQSAAVPVMIGGKQVEIAVAPAPPRQPALQPTRRRRRTAPVEDPETGALPEDEPDDAEVAAITGSAQV